MLQYGQEQGEDKKCSIGRYLQRIFKGSLKMITILKIIVLFFVGMFIFNHFGLLALLVYLFICWLIV